MIEHAADKDTISADHDECPAVCPALGERQSELCEHCEIRAARELYQESVSAALDEYDEDFRHGEKYKLKFLENAFDDALEFETMPRTLLTLTAARMVDIVAAERRRWKRRSDLQAQAEADAAANRGPRS